MNADPRARVTAAGLVGYGVLWLVVAGLIAVVIRLQVPTPEELLRDVAARPAVWIGANVALIGQQVLLVVVGPALGRLAGGATLAADTVRLLLALGGGALVASGIFHGVLGAHLASDVTPAPLDADLVRLAELVHALGDTCWFVGVGALIAVTAIVVLARWRGGAGPRWLALIGAAAVMCNVAQFGWFADHAFGVFAAPGTVLQAGWLAGAGLARWPGPHPGRAH